MKKLVIALLFVSRILAADFSKLDPQLGLLLKYPERVKYLAPSNGLSKIAGEKAIDVIVTFSGDKWGLREAGYKVYCSIGDIAVVSVPVKRLAELSEQPNVRFVEAATVSKPQLNESVPLTGAIKVREQMGYKGKGVIIGIIDSGIDWKHRDFIDGDGRTRIKYILDLSETGHYMGGDLYTEEDINDALAGLSVVSQYDYSGHGTHVAGIAAGDGSDGAGYGEFTGMAPEATLVVVKATINALSNEFLSTNQIKGMAFIDSVAAVLGMPYVMNMSFGGQGGAHDGTSPTERAIDKLVGLGIPGKAIVTVAGNDGEENNHAQAYKNQKSVNFVIDAYELNYSANDDMVIFDIWYSGLSQTSVTIISPSGQEHGPVQSGEVYKKNSAEGLVYAWNGYYEESMGDWLPGQNKNNGDYELYIEIRDDTALLPPKEGEWTLEFTGTLDTVDIYLATTNLPVHFTQGKVDFGKITIPGTARNVITVGSFLSKKDWYDLDNNHLTIDNEGFLKKGDISSFSSPGPTRDGRKKPDITAPGQMIASSYSEKANPYTSYSIFANPSSDYPNALVRKGGLQGLSRGTSMAAPHVAGAIALLLEKYPETTTYQLRQMLTKSAAADQFVGDTPNNYWGYGKLDVFSALQLTPGEEPPADYKLLNVYPNPFTQRSTIEFELPLLENRQNTKIEIYNILGQKVRSLVNETHNTGKYQVYWDGRDDLGYLLASGIYFIHFESGEFKQTRKVTFWPSTK
ncbi:S8 family serine peptidase [candidate division KSB1 bacterium]|nr:S8 family serine peptidase [candidate division KSB1 bacterium]